MSNYNPEYDDEAGMADNNLETLKRAVDGIDDVIRAGDNLPEWCQEKIAVAKSMLVTVWDYMRSEEERGVTETKKSHKRPKYSIKPRSSVLPAYLPGGDPKKKKKKNGYFEHLESKLSDSLQEQQDRMAGVGMGNYVVDKSPTEAIKPKSSVKCYRQGDEWVVQIKGTIVRIPTDEASSPEEAITQARANLGMSEARAMSPGLKAAQQNLQDLASGEVRRREEAQRAKAKREREQAKLDARAAKPKKPSSDEIWRRVEHAISNYFPDGDPTDYLNPYMERNGLNWDDITRAAKKNGYKDLWDYWNTLVQDIENDAYYDWMSAKRPEAPVNPLSKDAADIQHRNWVAKKNPKIRDRGPYMESNTPNWTHDTLAAKLFEQDLTYEDQLNSMLKRKLNK